MNPLLLLLFLPLLGVGMEDMILGVEYYYPDTPIMIKFINLHPTTEYGFMCADHSLHNFTAESTEYSIVSIFKWDWLEADGKTFILTFWRLNPPILLDTEYLERPQEGSPFMWEIFIPIVILPMILIFLIIETKSILRKRKERKTEREIQKV